MADTPKHLIPSSPTCRDPPPQPVDRRHVMTILWQLFVSRPTQSLLRPAVPSDLGDMSSLVRIHACLRLFLLDIEYSLSPGGHLRGFVKLLCRLSIIIAVLAVFAAGVLACLALVLTVIATITHQLVVILRELLDAALLIVALLVIAAGLVLAAKRCSRSSKGSSGSYACRSRSG